MWGGNAPEGGNFFPYFPPNTHHIASRLMTEHFVEIRSCLPDISPILEYSDMAAQEGAKYFKKFHLIGLLITSVIRAISEIFVEICLPLPAMSPIFECEEGGLPKRGNIFQHVFKVGYLSPI